MLTPQSYALTAWIDPTTQKLRLDQLGTVFYAISSRTQSIPPSSSDFTSATDIERHLIYGNLWLKFTVTASPEFKGKFSGILEIPAQPRLATLFHSKSSLPVAQSGVALPVNERSIPSAHIALPLTVAAGSTETFVVQIDSRYPLSMNLTLFSQDTWKQEHHQRIQYFALYLGAIGSLLLFNLIIYLINTSQIEKLYYCISQTFLHIGLPASLLGYTIHLWPNSAGWDYRLPYFLVGVGYPALAQFTIKFLNLRELSRAMYRLVLSSAILLALIAAVSYWLPAGAQSAVRIALFLSLLLILVAGSYAVYCGNQAARWFLVGTGTFLLSGITYLLVVHRIWSPSFLSTRPVPILQFGSFIDALTLACAISENLRQEKEKRLKAEHSLIRSLLKAKEAAEASNMVKNEFIRNMSHELRTPLTALTGFSSALIEDSHLEESSLQLAIIIKRQAEQLTCIVSDILDYAELENGQIKLKMEVFDLLELVLEVHNFFTPSAQHKGLTIKIDVSSSGKIYCSADRFRIRQILMNLVGNACKFTERGGIRIIVSRQSAVSAELSLNYICVQIEDSGPGIPPLAQPQLFEPFYQADASLTRLHGGTGLGLTVARGLARAMHCHIRLARSVVGIGSVFEICIPEADVSEKLSFRDFNLSFQSCKT